MLPLNESGDFPPNCCPEAPSPRHPRGRVLLYPTVKGRGQAPLWLKTTARAQAGPPSPTPAEAQWWPVLLYPSPAPGARGAQRGSAHPLPTPQINGPRWHLLSPSPLTNPGPQTSHSAERSRSPGSQRPRGRGDHRSALESQAGHFSSCGILDKSCHPT